MKAKLRCFRRPLSIVQRVGLSLLWMGLVLGFLAACATPREWVPPQDLVEPEQWFAEHPSWRVQGRMALSDGQSGGQMSIGWRQAGESATIDLRAGLGRQWWRLSFDETKASLEGSEQEALLATEPEALVYEATGWPIPIEAFGQWVKGLPSARDEALVFDEAGRLVSLVYEGWDVQLSGYELAWSEEGQAVELPSRFEFRKSPLRLRVALNRWDWLKSESGE